MDFSYMNLKMDILFLQLPCVFDYSIHKLIQFDQFVFQKLPFGL